MKKRIVFISYKKKKFEGVDTRHTRHPDTDLNTQKTSFIILKNLTSSPRLDRID